MEKIDEHRARGYSRIQDVWLSLYDYVIEGTGITNVLLLKFKIEYAMQGFFKLHEMMMDEFEFPREEFKDACSKPND